MGSFYSTSNGSWTQNLIPEWDTDLMDQALAKHEEDLEKSKKSAGLIDQTLATIDNLYVDNEAANLKKQEYRDRADALTQKLQNDPANYLKYSQDLTNLSRDLAYELDTGVLGKAKDRYDASNKMKADLDKRNDLSSSSKDLWYKAIEKHEKAKGGLSYQDENVYREFNAGFDYTDVLSDFDEVSVINTMNQAWENDKDLQAWASANAGYINSGTKGSEYITGSSVEKAFKGILDNNDFRDITQQRVFLEFYNKGLVESKDDPLVMQEVNKREDAFIQSAVEKIAFKQDISTRQKHGDALSGQLHMQNLNQVGKATQKYQMDAAEKQTFNKKIEMLPSSLQEIVGNDVEQVGNYLKNNYSDKDQMITYLTNNFKWDYSDADAFITKSMEDVVYEETHKFVDPNKIKANSETERNYIASLYNGQDGHIATQVKTMNSTENNDKIVITVDGVSTIAEGKTLQEAYNEILSGGNESIGIGSTGNTIVPVTGEYQGRTVYYDINNQPYASKQALIDSGQPPLTKEVPMNQFDVGKAMTQGEVSFQQNKLDDNTNIVNSANFVIMENGQEKIVTVEIVNDANNYDFDKELNTNIIGTFEGE